MDTFSLKEETISWKPQNPKAGIPPTIMAGQQAFWHNFLGMEDSEISRKEQTIEGQKLSGRTRKIGEET